MTKFQQDFIGSFIGGCDSGVDPHLLPRNKLAWLVNGTVRGGYVSPRPKFIYPAMVDGSGNGGPSLVATLSAGLFQGSCFYDPLPASVLPDGSLMALISGRLYSFTPDWIPSAWDGNGYATAFTGAVGSIGVAEWTPSNRTDTNSQTAPQAFLGQAENYVIAQDGVTQNVLVFDGNKCFRSNPNSVTVGTVSGSTATPAQGSSVVVTITPSSGVSLSNFVNGSLSLYGTGSFAGMYVGDASISLAQPGSIVLKSTSGFTANVGDSVWLQTATYDRSTQTINEPGYTTAYSNTITVNSANANNAQNTAGFLANSLYATVVVAQYAVPLGAPAGSPPIATGATTTLQSSPITPSLISAGSYMVNLPADPYGQNSVIKSLSLSYTIQAANPTYSYTPVGTVSAQQVINANTLTGVNLVGNATYPSTSQQGAVVFVGSNSATPAANNPATIYSSTNGTSYYLTNISINPATYSNLNGYTVKSKIGIPCGLAWTYSQGRVWTSLPSGKSFVAGDIVGGSSGTLVNGFKDAILFTNTNTLLAGGSTFSIPNSGGVITALRAVPTLDVSLGQGPLQVFTTNSVFSCNAPADASTWASLTSPIVTESLIGSGAVSQAGTVLVNSDIIFRSQDGIRSLTISRLDFNKWANTPISREVGRVVDYDNSALINFCSAVDFDNRVIMSASPVQTSNGVTSTSAVVINLDTVSNLQSKSPAVYDGVWTGLATLQFTSGIINNANRCFAFCQRNGGIAVSEILKSISGQDYPSADATVMQFESPVLFTENEIKGKYELLRLEDGEIYVQNILGVVQFAVEFQPDYDTNWYPWYSWFVDNSQNQSPSKLRMGLGPPPTLADANRDRQNRDAYNYQIRVTIQPVSGTSKVGSAQFMGGMFKASLSPQTEFAKPIVNTTTTPATPVYTIIAQVFAGSGVPTVQNPGSLAGIYYNAAAQTFSLWLGTQWDGGITPSGSQSVVLGAQCFAGSGPPTQATPTPDGNAGTYYDYTNKTLTFWNPAGYWDGNSANSGSGKVPNSAGQQVLMGVGVPSNTLKPPLNAGIYYNTQTLTVYNWNPTGNFGAGSWV